jgi:hypothetical protein
LFSGRIERQLQSPTSHLPMGAPGGRPAAHALPGTEQSSITHSAKPTLPQITFIKAPDVISRTSA